jgi:hypothetical protein
MDSLSQFVDPLQRADKDDQQTEAQQQSDIPRVAPEG